MWAQGWSEDSLRRNVVLLNHGKCRGGDRQERQLWALLSQRSHPHHSFGIRPCELTHSEAEPLSILLPVTPQGPPGLRLWSSPLGAPFLIFPWPRRESLCCPFTQLCASTPLSLAPEYVSVPTRLQVLHRLPWVLQTTGIERCRLGMPVPSACLSLALVCFADGTLGLGFPSHLRRGQAIVPV